MRLLTSLVLAALLSLGAGAAQAACTLPAQANAFASQMASALNRERSRHGLPALRYNGEVARAAAAHACDMQQRGFFDHTGSNGSNAMDRVRRTRAARPCRVAENIAYGYPSAEIVVQGWMNSSGHRRNMLQPDVREFGIGLADAPGGPYAVMVFYRGC